MRLGAVDNLWQSPLSIGLWSVAVLGLVLPMILGPILRAKMHKATAKRNTLDPLIDNTGD